MEVEGTTHTHTETDIQVSLLLFIGNIQGNVGIYREIKIGKVP